MMLFGRAILFLAICATGHAAVVRPAPDFALEATPKRSTLQSFRGQPVVLVIASDAQVKLFRRQVRRLKEMYSHFANEKVLFVAAVVNGPAIVPSDVPFALAANPARVAADYGVTGGTGGFAIAVIGVDGNLDMITAKIIPARRILDVIFNNSTTQEAERKPLSS
jgi:hypothetical protein